jgi:hypothetical protein
MNHKRPELGPVAVGDELIVTENLSRRNTRTIPVEVTAVGRTWLTVKAADGGYLRDDRFHMGTGTIYAPGKSTGNPPRIRTPEQIAWDGREAAAHAYLRENGIDVHGSRRWAHDKVTLANLIREHEGLDPL